MMKRSTEGSTEMPKKTEQLMQRKMMNLTMIMIVKRSLAWEIIERSMS